MDSERLILAECLHIALQLVIAHDGVNIASFGSLVRFVQGNTAEFAFTCS